MKIEAKNINDMNKEELEEIPISAIISTIHRYHSMYINRKLKDYGITIGQFPILICLANDIKPKTQNEIATTFKLNDGTITRALQKLEEKELIKRKTDPDNKRRNLIVLSKKGKTLAQELNHIDEDWEKDIFVNLSSKDISNLKWALHDITLKSIRKIEEV